jgi:hypothetical protein
MQRRPFGLLSEAAHTCPAAQQTPPHSQGPLFNRPF